jgi:hypothetical protein
MNFFKKFFLKRKLKSDLEVSKLKADLAQQKAKIAIQKHKKVSSNIKNIVDAAENIEDLKSIIGENRNQLLEVLESPAVSPVISALIAKLGGGEKGTNALIAMLKAMPPEEKQKLIAEFMSGGKK